MSRKLAIEVRNESNRKLYVKLCKSMSSGRRYLHIDTKPSRHIDICVKAGDYEVVEENRVKW